MGVECNGMNLPIIRVDGEYGCECVIGGISLNDHLGVQDPVVEDQSGGKCLFQRVESFTSFCVEVPMSVFAG